MTTTTDTIRRLAAHLLEDPGDEAAKTAMLRAIKRSRALVTIEASLYGRSLFHRAFRHWREMAALRDGLPAAARLPSAIDMWGASRGLEHRLRQLTGEGEDDTSTPHTVIYNHGFVAPMSIANAIRRAQPGLPLTGPIDFANVSAEALAAVKSLTARMRKMDIRKLQIDDSEFRAGIKALVDEAMRAFDVIDLRLETTLARLQAVRELMREVEGATAPSSVQQDYVQRVLAEVLEHMKELR